MEHTPEQGKALLDEINAMILLPDSPMPGDFIALDWDGADPIDFRQGISWFCSQVLEKDGDRYKVAYDDGARWYTFTDFDTPKLSRNGVSYIYPARAPA